MVAEGARGGGVLPWSLSRRAWAETTRRSEAHTACNNQGIGSAVPCFPGDHRCCELCHGPVSAGGACRVATFALSRCVPSHFDPGRELHGRLGPQYLWSGVPEMVASPAASFRWVCLLWDPTRV